jgi:hypothetical protein
MAADFFGSQIEAIKMMEAGRFFVEAAALLFISPKKSPNVFISLILRCFSAGPILDHIVF